jgi:cholesterol oxidase
VLSAGALGTPYLLFKNQRAFPQLSPALGSRFSTNGDFLGFALRARRNADGRRVPWLLDPSYGPVITSALRIPDAVDGVPGAGRGFYIEDAGYPQLLNWLVERGLPGGGLRLARFLLTRALAYVTGNPSTSIGGSVSRALGRNLLTASSMPLLGMGRDVPQGQMALRGDHLSVDWSSAPSREYFGRVNHTMRDVAHAMGAIYASAPLWWLNLLITVHPLGGAPMAGDPARGVVDPWGQVYGYPGLSIADGSVMPGPVGANPSLTIAALADRFADRILEQGVRPARD